MDATKIKATLTALVTLLASLSWLSVKFEQAGGWLAANLDNIMLVATLAVAFLPQIQKLWVKKPAAAPTSSAEVADKTKQGGTGA